MASLIFLCGAVASSGPSPARAAGTVALQQRVSGDQRRVSGLSAAVSAAATRINQLGSSISALKHQITALQSQLDVKRTRLLQLRGRLDSAGTKLTGFQAAEGRAERVLARQAIGTYEADSPDIVTVVLESTGFDDLLEQIAFAERIGRQDARIVDQVRTARSAVAGQAVRLGTLSARQQRLTDQVLYERNRIARARLRLVTQQLAAARERRAETGQVDALSNQLVELQAVGAQPQASGTRTNGSSQTPSGSATPPATSAFTFPMPKGDVSPPGTWSSAAGVDMAAPGDTPELAVCSGTVVLHGIGGFGPSAPVLHCDSPLAGYSYVYYGFAGPGRFIPIGTHVDAGHTISEVGSGIVGISTGPHLEIGFADSSGSPIGPSSEPTMMSLLRSAYSR
jgi:murein DD-endopeptidase MepM/ murein hydrolase activator NlpD